MGVVYEAEQVSLGRHVALKVLPPQSLKDVKQRRRFEREARAAAKLHHTNIVPVFGVGEEHETPYYVMQFIQGQGLDAVLDELKRLRLNPGKGSQAEAGTDADGTAAYQPMRRDVSAADVARSLLTGRFDPAGDQTVAPDETPSVSPPTEAVSDALSSSSSLSLPGVPQRGKSKRQSYWQGVARIGHQVADALAYAHGQGIVHRDIKPSNLLLDTKGTVWVADFGLAKATDSQDLTHTGDLLGTLRYMPPEAFGGKADSRGDIYSLGLTLYEMLAFRPAFDERDRGQLVKQVTTEEPPKLKKLNPEVPRDLETIIQKAIERDPAHRYLSASELADDLRRFVDDEPIQARRATAAERLARWGRRNPAVATLAAAVAVLLSAVIGGLWYNVEASKRALMVQTRLRAEAEQEKHNAELAAARESEQKAIAITAMQKAESANKSLVASQDSLRSTLYAAQMNLAKVAWDSGAPARLLDLLASTVPKPGEPDPRGFEWHYSRRQAHSERTVRKLPGICQSIFPTSAFSPDGSLLATLDEPDEQRRSRNLVVYDTATGRLLHKIPFEVPYVRNSTTAAIALSGDGKVVALRLKFPVLPENRVSGTQDWLIQTIVWNLRDQSVLFRDSEAINATFGLQRVAVSGDGSRIAIALYGLDRIAGNISTATGSFRVLDVNSGREYFHMTSSTEVPVNVQLSSDGRLVATANFSSTGPGLYGDISSRLVIQEVETGRVRFDSGDLKGIRSNALQFSPDGHRLAAITSDSSFAYGLMIVDVDHGRQIATEFLPGSSITSNLAFDPDGRSLVVASRSGPGAQVHDGTTGRLLKSLSLGVGEVDDLVIRRSDGRLLIHSGEDLREWDLPPANPASLDSGLTLKNVSISGTTLDRPFVLSRDGRQLIVLRMSTDRSKPEDFAVHDVTTGEVIRQFPSHEAGAGPDPNSQVSSMRVNAAGTRLAALIGDATTPESANRLGIWDLTTGRQLLTLDRERLGGLPYALSPQAWNDVGTRVAVSVRHADVLPDGKVAVRPQWFVAIIDVPSGRIVRTLPVSSSAPSASFRSDGKLLAVRTNVAGVEGRVTRVELVDPDSGRIVLERSGNLPSGVGALFIQSRWPQVGRIRG